MSPAGAGGLLRVLRAQLLPLAAELLQVPEVRLRLPERGPRCPALRAVGGVFPSAQGVLIRA